MFRSEPKGVADTYAIASLPRDINWREIVSEAKSREIGADPEVLYDILRSFLLDLLYWVKWIKRPETGIFARAIKIYC